MTEPNRQSGENEERIIEIEIERLRPFKEHPFQVKDDKEMFLLQESIEKYGILNPLIVRPVPDGYYEIISGHRRKHAAEKLGYRKVPVIIRVLSEDDSILSMVDSNLHRERISYSEKAFAYKLKNDVLKRKSGRKKSQVDHKTPRKRAIEIISEDCGDSPKQVQRYISLTKLIPEMLQKLDDEIISFCPAVEIAALSEKEQKELLVAMEYAQAIPSLSQAQRIRQMSKEKQLSLEKMEEIMCEVKKGEITRVAFTNEQLHKYFPNSYTPAMMKREILALGNVAVFDTESSIPPERFAYALNQRLPEDIVVVRSDEVPADWHPRYQENISKTYEYHIYNAAVPNPLKTRYCTFVSFPMDVEAMRAGAKYLVGEHDFVSFCNIRTNTQDTVRTVYDLIIEKKDDEIVLRVTGNGFLYNMVRIIAGVLIRVGRGFYAPEKVKEILDAKVHTSEGATAPPNGLVLMKIDYN